MSHLQDRHRLRLKFQAYFSLSLLKNSIKLFQKYWINLNSKVNAFITSFTMIKSLKKIKKRRKSIIPKNSPNMLSVIIINKNRSLNLFCFFCCNRLK